MSGATTKQDMYYHLKAPDWQHLCGFCAGRHHDISALLEFCVLPTEQPSCMQHCQWPMILTPVRLYSTSGTQNCLYAILQHTVPQMATAHNA